MTCSAALLRVARQLGREGGVAHRARAARARSLDRLGLEPVPAPSEEQLGGVGDQLRAAEIEVRSVGHRVPRDRRAYSAGAEATSGATNGCVMFTWYASPEAR